MSDSAVQKYIRAFDGILTPEELARAAQEEAQFQSDLKIPSALPRSVVRNISDFLSDDTKRDLVKTNVRKADADPDPERDLGEIADKLDRKVFSWKPGDDTLSVIDVKQGNLIKIGASFPKDQKKSDWPTLVLINNSNLVAPQAFYDSFTSAEKLLGALGMNTEKMQMQGVYFSRKHLHGNSKDTMDRYFAMNDLEASPLKEMTPASRHMFTQLEMLIAEREDNGRMKRVDVGDKKLVLLRSDARDILDHVVMYGYSAGYGANKDAARALVEWIREGNMAIAVHDTDAISYRKTNHKDAKDIVAALRHVGVAGQDNVASQTALDYVKAEVINRDVNFVSPGDFSLALNGSDFYPQSPQYPLQDKSESPNLAVVTPHVNRVRRALNFGLGEAPLPDSLGGHAQASYVEALTDPANSHILESASYRLGLGRIGPAPGM